MSDIAALKKRRAYIKGSLTKLLNYINTITTSTNIEDIKVRLSNTERYRNEFMEIENKIVTLDNNEDLDTDFEDNYYRAVAGLSLALRTKIEPPVSLNDTMIEASMAGAHAEVKLPKISITCFSGDYTEWQSFHDLFCSTIHDNHRLTPSQKLQYLKGSLKGEASGLLKHFSITDANYIEALKKLRERYDRKKHTIQAFIKNFMCQPSVTTANSMNVRRLLDTSDEIIRGLKALGDEAESRDHWLIHIMVNKLDDETNNLWAQASAEYNLPTLKQFFEFLSRRIDALECLKGQNKRFQLTSNHPKPAIKSHTVSSSLVEPCSICPTEHHKLFECVKFKEMTVHERKSLLINENRCFNCFNNNHNVYNCKSRFRCKQCNRKHHSLLHEDVATKSATNCNQTEAKTLNYTTNTQVGDSLLPTALVRVLDGLQQNQLCRVLLDSGSQGSFITERCAQKLQLKRNSAKLAISGIGAITNGYTRGAVSLEITPWNKTEPRFHVEAFVFPKLTTKQRAISKSINLREIKQYELADPHFYNGADIDIIIGADSFFEMLTYGKIVTKNQLIMQNTLLGWVIAGKASEVRPKQSFTITIDNVENDLENLLRRFWEIENIEVTRPHLSQEEQLCEKCFDDTKTIDESGRIKVGLPFKIAPSVLGCSYPKAVQRMHSIERRFARDHEFAALYKAFMIEYLNLGHMKEVDNDFKNNYESTYYLPHHGVVKGKGKTTKLRVVFDGSATTTTGKSLNDCLAVGPTIQSSLYEILSRFRKYKVAITADIEKMYRQIRIREADTRFQRIIWREEPNKPFTTYELQTVTYGTASASYLATRAVIEAANKYNEEYPQTVNRIKTDMYIDDLMTGADTLNEAINIKNQTNFILGKSGFQLHKWLSNEGVLNDALEPGTKANILEIEKSSRDSTKVLGLHWNPIKDTFQFEVSLNDQATTTKRGILSEASRLFDPLGWLAPITINIKVFIQSLWAEHLSWDDQLPPNLLNQWSKLRDNLVQIENIELSRYLNTNSESKIVLHGFSDASKQAYSAVVYGKITQLNGDSVVKLLSAKTKVAPVKQLSIPRLELCGALLLSRLLLSVKQALKSEISEIVAWTDSTIVLDWLSAHPNKWNTFVGNRTGEILTNFNRSQWRHVDTKDNPADCASRGMEPEKLEKFALWWNGPKWLVDSLNWPINIINHPITREDSRCQSMSVQIPQNTLIDDLVEKNSSFRKIIRILAYVVRFINIRLKQVPKTSILPILLSSDLQKSRCLVFGHIQRKHFEMEIGLIAANKDLPKSSKLKYLNPYLDESGLLRVGGRIKNAAVTYDIKHPIILPANENLTELIVREHHIKHLHAGQTLMMATLRNSYWIIGCRNLIKKIVHSCVTCVKYRAKELNQIMGDLPIPRVELVRPFHKVGVDYAGPFTTHLRRGRGQKSYKSYVCIFICLATKAVHIELVSELTTDAYIAALRRFIARRGICKEIQSDNGTNFIGARNHLYQFFHFLRQNANLYSDFLLTDQIEFKFIPPSSPHFGGLWEAAVKSVKYHLRRVTNGHILTMEEMSTLLTEIEAMMNSRPICVLSGDDLDYLTPGHFLIGRPTTQLPSENLNEVKMSKLSRWQIITKMNQHIWKRWHLEYLTSLQHRNKWHRQQSNIKVGDVVVVKDNNLPTSKWLLGKIIEVHPGADNNIRVVTLKTKFGNIRRPIQKLCLLPVG